MAQKTKNKSASRQIQDIASNAGLLLMTAAATTLMIEVPEHHDKRAVLVPQPVYSAPGQIAEHETQHGSSEMRRERDETHPHYHGYSVTQRTPGRTGRI